MSNPLTERVALYDLPPSPENVPNRIGTLHGYAYKQEVQSATKPGGPPRLLLRIRVGLPSRHPLFGYRTGECAPWLGDSPINVAARNYVPMGAVFQTFSVAAGKSRRALRDDCRERGIGWWLGCMWFDEQKEFEHAEQVRRYLNRWTSSLVYWFRHTARECV